MSSFQNILLLQHFLVEWDTLLPKLNPTVQICEAILDGGQHLAPGSIRELPVSSKGEVTLCLHVNDLYVDNDDTFV